jgi:tryptophan-rich sensory protein
VEETKMKSGDPGSSRLFMENIAERVVALLLLVEAISVFLLWNLDPLTSQGQDAFALYLAVDLVAFAMMSYLYRELSSEGMISKVLIIAGCVFIAVLFFVSFTLTG